MRPTVMAATARRTPALLGVRNRSKFFHAGHEARTAEVGGYGRRMFRSAAAIRVISVCKAKTLLRMSVTPDAVWLR